MRVDKRSFAVLWVLATLLLPWLTSCVTAPSRTPGIDGEFQARGKLGLRAPDVSLSARFVWRQRGDEFDVELWGPLGQGRTRLVGGAGSIRILDGGGAVLDEGPADAIMDHYLGWRLPLAEFPFWLKGLPNPGEPVKDLQRSSEGRIQAFAQAGWQVSYQAYSKVSGASVGNALPRRLRASNGHYQARFVISQWQ